MEKNYKRKYRERGEATKKKISAALRNRSKSAEHRNAISQAMKIYWEGVPSHNNGDENTLYNGEE